MPLNWVTSVYIPFQMESLTHISERDSGKNRRSRRSGSLSSRPLFGGFKPIGKHTPLLSDLELAETKKRQLRAQHTNGCMSRAVSIAE